MKGKTIVVWFSCGAASAVAAKKTLEKYGEHNTIRIVNNPIKEEDPDNIRFLRDVEAWLGVEIETAVNPKYPDASCVGVWADRRFMSGVAGAPCTLELKKRARQHWEDSNPTDWLVLGFTAEEQKRSDNFKMSERENLLPVLIDEGLTKKDCFRVLQEAGLDVPAIYKRKYPNANCIGCVKATSPTYWNHVRVQDPDVFLARAEQSRDIGARLVRVKGERIFLDELDPGAKGASMKNMDFECGIFCEEKPLEDTQHKGDIAKQRDAINFLQTRDFAMLSLCPGYGKCRVSLLALPDDVGRLIIICPTVVLLHWKAEIAKWRPGLGKVQIIKSSKDKIDLGARVHVVAYGVLTNRLKAGAAGMPEPDAVIVDEFHNIKTPYSNRRGKMKGQRTRATLRVWAQARIGYMLSGTPILNRPSELGVPLKAFGHPY